MTTELTMLAASVALLILLVAVLTVTGLREVGFGPLAGSRDHLPPPGRFLARARRCVDNHREGLTMFAPLVLIAAAAHISTPMTVLGSQLFFYSRVAHALLYLTGAPLIRPLVFTVGMAGTIMILVALFVH